MAQDTAGTVQALMLKREELCEAGVAPGNARLILLTNLIACVLTNATNLVTDASHGLANGDRVQMGGTALPAELDNRIYHYVINATTDTYQLSLTPGGAAETFTTDGTSVSYRVMGANVELNADTFQTPTSTTSLTTMLLNVTPVPTATPLKDVVVTRADWTDSDELLQRYGTVGTSGTDWIINNATLSTAIDVEVISCALTQPNGE